ncbi:YidH family protein [Arachidicoccus sp.]|jgi:putative membrane protein|uniref:YidH family protein n=1 Tax=Arachidicoccus sp. TaxID=1872624 RepID=UPI003D1BF455
MQDNEIKDSLDGMKKLIELSRQRSQLSAERSYMNAERTLSVWLRTALASMIFGIAIDRLGLMLDQMPQHVVVGIHVAQPDIPSKIIGIILIVFSMLMAFFSGLRFIRFARYFKKEYVLPAYHKASLPASFASMIIVFGIGLLILMIWIG